MSAIQNTITAPTIIYGTDGRDTIEFLTGPVEIWAYGDYDIIRTGSFDDIVYGGTGGALIVTAGGNDLIYADMTSDDPWMGGTIRSGTGQDTVYGSINGYNFISDELGDDSDFLNGGNISDTIISGNGDDFIFAGGGNDQISDTGASLGNDTIDAGDGNDIVYSGYGHDSITGGLGDDWIHDGDGNDSIDSGGGNDDVYAGWGHDSVDGGWGNDFIRADAGDDIVIGGFGDDIIYGGGGNDRIRGDSGNDVISDLKGNNLLTDNGGNNHIVAGSGSDTIIGGKNSDILMGGGGDDSIMGGSTHETSSTGAAAPSRWGIDKIYGQGGNDTLQNGDSVNIGVGPEFSTTQYYYTGSDGNDRIFDFTIHSAGAIIDPFKSGHDTLMITKNINGSGIEDHDDIYGRITDAINGALIDLGGNSTILLIDVTAAQLRDSPHFESYFEFV